MPDSGAFAIYPPPLHASSVDRPQVRGWLPSWDKSSLALQTPAELTNHPCFLSSIWMSGYGLALDNSGDIYFTTEYRFRHLRQHAEHRRECGLDVRRSDHRSRLFYAVRPQHNGQQRSGLRFGWAHGVAGPTRAVLSPVGAGKDGGMFVLNRDGWASSIRPTSPIMSTLANAGVARHISIAPRERALSAAGEQPVGGSQVNTWALTSLLGRPP